MKRELKLISIMEPVQEGDIGFCRLDPEEATRIAYVDNMHREPKNFPEDSLAGKQFLYNPRKRKNAMSIEELTGATHLVR